MDNLMDRALARYNQSDIEGAIELFQQAALETGNHMAWYNLGVCFQDKQRYSEAIAAFEKSGAINPAHVPSWYNVGVCYQETKQYKEALSNFEKLFSVDHMTASSLNNIGFVLSEMGKADEACDIFKTALYLFPNHFFVGRNYVANLCRNLPMEKWFDICDMVLQKEEAHNNAVYLATIYRACTEWAVYQKGSIPHVTMPQEDQEWVRSLGSYERFVTALLNHKDESLYEDAPEKPVSMVGDSHILSFAGLTFAGKKIMPQLVMGAKAFHIASPAPNKYITALKCHIDRLPEGADLLCSFGEIDCRTNTGILPYQQKAGGDLQEIVDKQVSNYVQAVESLAQKKKLNLIFVNIVAAHESRGDRRDVVKFFNEALRKEAKAVIDLYTPIVAADGYAAAESHLDGVHLRPKIAAEILASQFQELEGQKLSKGGQ